MTREHTFTDDVVVLPRAQSKAEIEKIRWARFEIRHLDNAILAQVGHYLTGEYVERFWLPVVGPTSIAIARNLVRRPVGSTVLLSELAAEMGCRESVTMHTLARMVRFDMMERRSTVVMLRPYLGALNLHHFSKLPAHIQQAHKEFVES